MGKASQTATINVSSLHAKIDRRVTAGLQPWTNSDLKERIPAEKAAIICDYVIAMQRMRLNLRRRRERTS
jgi:hypothetical protein